VSCLWPSPKGFCWRSCAKGHDEVISQHAEGKCENTAELVLAAGFDTSNVPAETARLLALEPYREDKVSLGRGSELCQMPVEQFMESAAQHYLPLHYGVD